MEPRNEFSAKGFLGMAKGPTRGLYYLMLPDLSGEERLQVAKAYRYNEGEKTKQAIGLTLPVIENQWFGYYAKFKAKYPLTNEQIVVTKQIFDQYIDSLREYTAEKIDDIKAYSASLRRHEKVIAAGVDGSEHQKKWDWDRQMKLRKEGAQLTDEPERMGANLQMALWCELTGSQKSLGKLPPIAYGQNRIPLAGVITNTPFVRDFATPSRLGFLDLAVTLGLSAIGVCLMLGFCTRLAALGGAAFMFNVCLSQFPWPTVYPYSPEVVGHYMLFGKDAIELLVLLLLAIVPAGRWGGLDWFLWNFGGKRLMAMYGWKKDPLSPDALVTEPVMAEKQAA